VISWYRSNPEQMQNVEMGVLEDQVVDLILAQSTVEEVVASYADVLSGAAIAEPEAEASSEGFESEVADAQDVEQP
jgi:trigger factor